jgi:hypothetical protein
MAGTQRSSSSARVFVAIGLLLMAFMPGRAEAAVPVDRSHENFSDTFPEELCGVPVTTTISGIVSSTEYSDGTFRTTFQFRGVSTAENGKSVQISGAGQVTGPADPIENPDGTLTFVTTQSGLAEKLSIAGGPTLMRDAGVVTLAQTFRLNPDGSMDFVSLEFSGLHGPHPDLLSGFELFCDVIVAALT